MVKWVARLAILAALLGVVGTFSIVAYLHRNQNKEKPDAPIKKDVALPQTVDTVTLDTSHRPILRTEKPVTASASPAVDSVLVIKKTDSAVKSVIDLAKAEKKIIDTIHPQTDKQTTVVTKEAYKKLLKSPVTVEKHQAILFTRQQLKKILARLLHAKEKNRIKTNCVQLFSTKETTNTKRMLQVETYLKTQHFTIAGRERITEKIRGIYLELSGQCLKLTIGSF